MNSAYLLRTVTDPQVDSRTCKVIGGYGFKDLAVSFPRDIFRDRNRATFSISAISTHHANQTLRLRVGKRLQQNGVDDGKHRAIGSYPESQCRDGHQREARILPKKSRRVSKIMQKRPHGVVY